MLPHETRANVDRRTADTITTLQSQLTTVTEERDRLREAMEFVARWAWRTDPPNASGKLADSDRLSVIKFYPVVKKFGQPHIELAERERQEPKP